MFIQILSMIRNNSYITHKEHNGNKTMKHNKFILNFINELMKRVATSYLDEVQDESNHQYDTLAHQDNILMSDISSMSRFTIAIITATNSIHNCTTSSYASKQSNRRVIQLPTGYTNTSTNAYLNKIVSTRSSKRKSSTTAVG